MQLVGSTRSGAGRERQRAEESRGARWRKIVRPIAQQNIVVTKCNPHSKYPNRSGADILAVYRCR